MAATLITWRTVSEFLAVSLLPTLAITKSPQRNASPTVMRRGSAWPVLSTAGNASAATPWLAALNCLETCATCPARAMTHKSVVVPCPFLYTRRAAAAVDAATFPPTTTSATILPNPLKSRQARR